MSSLYHVALEKLPVNVFGRWYQTDNKQSMARSYGIFHSFKGECPNFQPRCRYLKFTFASLEWSQGWRLTTLLAFVASSVVFVTSLALLVWYYTSAPMTDGVKVLYSGSCNKASSVDTWIHLMINVFSTTLLASSNFCGLIIKQNFRLSATTLMISLRHAKIVCSHPTRC